MAFISVAAQHRLYLCVNAVPFRSNMPALYVKQRCDPDHSFFFPPTLALSKSIPSDVEEPFGLSVLRDANYMRREKTGRWREARTETKMRRRCGNTKRQMRGRREEIKGDRRRDITLMI